MFVVAFVVLFAGSVSSVLAGATTALLASFILPVSLPGSTDALPSRLAGWGLAGAVSVLAIAVMWPAPTGEPLRQATARACALLARRLRAEVDAIRDGFAPDRRAALDAATAEASEAVAALRASFFEHALPADRAHDGGADAGPGRRPGGVARGDTRASAPWTGGRKRPTARCARSRRPRPRSSSAALQCWRRSPTTAPTPSIRIAADWGRRARGCAGRRPQRCRPHAPGRRRRTCQPTPTRDS